MRLSLLLLIIIIEYIKIKLPYTSTFITVLKGKGTG